MRAFAAGILSALVAMAAAYTQPDYSKPPSGNPILYPGLAQQVPAGKPFTITWKPTTPNDPVSLVLLRGPSTDVQPIMTLAESIPNTGSFVWTPSTTLVPDVTHYGLLLVDDKTAAYQYSTQFGISNPEYKAVGSSSSAAAGGSSATGAGSSTAVTSTSTVSMTLVTPTTMITTTLCPSSSSAAATGTGSTSVPVVAPTKTPTMPSSLQPTGSATTPASPTFTGAAGRNVLSLGAVAAGVVAVLAL